MKFNGSERRRDELHLPVEEATTFSEAVRWADGVFPHDILKSVSRRTMQKIRNFTPDEGDLMLPSISGGHIGVFHDILTACDMVSPAPSPQLSDLRRQFGDEEIFLTMKDEITGFTESTDFTD